MRGAPHDVPFVVELELNRESLSADPCRNLGRSLVEFAPFELTVVRDCVWNERQLGEVSQTLAGRGLGTALPQRAGRRLFGLMPSAARCKFCNAPFKGRYGGVVKTIGYTPSRKNPHICARCIERAPEGGAVVPVAVLFADVRGYTALCEQLGPDEVASVVQTFYETSSSALLAHEGLLGQIAGDEIEGIFVPGLAGPNYRRKAVEAARTLVRAVRYTSLEVGIGVASGEEFVGNVAGGGYKDFAAVGDVPNVAARLTSNARDA